MILSMQYLLFGDMVEKKKDTHSVNGLPQKQGAKFDRASFEEIISGNLDLSIRTIKKYGKRECNRAAEMIEFVGRSAEKHGLTWDSQ